MTNRKGEAGFSYIDVTIAMVILLIGVLGAAGALMVNVVRSYETEKQVVAKQMALSAVESVFSAREIARPDGVKGWDQIGNVGSNPVNGVNQGLFLTGWCPIREESGPDGVAGTSDDACAANMSCPSATGPVNDSPVISGYERKIVITDLQDPERPSPPYSISRRRVDVTVRYQINQLFRSQTVSTIVTNY
jgi:Tfp pilus assembly protein PilV